MGLEATINDITEAMEGRQMANASERNIRVIGDDGAQPVTDYITADYNHASGFAPRPDVAPAVGLDATI